MSLGKEMKDFLAAYAALNKQNEDRRYHDILDRYYNKKKDDTDGADAAAKAEINRLNSRSGSSGTSSSGNRGAKNIVYDGPLDSSAPGAPSPKAVYASAIANGATPNEAHVLAGAAASESGLNPNITHDGGIGFGLFGHNGDRLASMRAYAGSDKPDWQSQVGFALKELRSRPEGKLVNDAKTTEDLAKAQMHFEQPTGYTRANPENGDNYTGRLNTLKRFNDLRSGDKLSAIDPSDQTAIPTDQVAMADTTSPSYGSEPMAVPDYTESAATGGMIEPVKKYLGGGLDEEDDDEEDTAPTPGSRNAPPGLPGSRGVPVPSGGGSSAEDNSGKDTILGMALHAGLTGIKNLFGLSEANAAEGKAAVPTQEAAKRQRLFSSNMGAMSPEEYDQVMKAVDPNGEMDEHVRSLAGLKGRYEYHMNRGEFTKAQQAAASMIQRSRDISAQFGAAAEDAVKSGQYPQAVQLLKKAYANTPDGNSIDAQVDKNGNGTMDVIDKEGKVIARHGFTPQAMLAAATGMKNGTLFYDSIMKAAGNNLGKDPSGAYQNAVRTVYGLNKDEAPPPPPSTSQTTAAIPSDGGGDTTGSVTPAVPNAPVPDAAVPGAAPAPAPAVAIPEPPAAGSAPAAPATQVPPNAQTAIPTTPELPQLRRSPIVPFEKNNPRPVMPDDIRQAIGNLARTDPERAGLLKEKWERDNLHTWESRKKDYDAEAQRQSNLEYNQSSADRAASLQSQNADRREQASQAAQDQRAKGMAARADKAEKNRQEHEKRMEDFKQDHEIRMKGLEQSKPLDFDTTDDAAIKKVQDVVEGTIKKAFSTPDGKPMMDDNGKPVDPMKMYSPEHVQSIRDAVIQVHRYNKWPLDTAAQAVLAMTSPTNRDGGLSLYKVKPIKGAPEDPTYGARVKVTFEGNNALAKSIVLPEDVVDQLDIIRGAQLKRMVLEGNALNKSRLDRRSDDLKVEGARERQRKEITSGVASGALQTNIDERPSAISDTPYAYGN